MVYQPFWYEGCYLVCAGLDESGTKFSACRRHSNDEWTPAGFQLYREVELK